MGERIDNPCLVTALVKTYHQLNKDLIPRDEWRIGLTWQQYMELKRDYSYEMYWSRLDPTDVSVLFAGLVLTAERKYETRAQKIFDSFVGNTDFITNIYLDLCGGGRP